MVTFLSILVVVVGAFAGTSLGEAWTRSPYQVCELECGLALWIVGVFPAIAVGMIGAFVGRRVGERFRRASLGRIAGGLIAAFPVGFAAGAWFFERVV